MPLEGLPEALAAEVAPFGIQVLIVEPGSFRTSLFAAADFSDSNGVYADTVGTTRSMVASSNGSQPGDPAKAAAAIVAALDAEHPPLRLALGADAVDAILAHTDAVRADLHDWCDTSRNTLVDE
jgi:NAD(P)-dependent dehydrogenase (short-subunit alcohol dehydrogenase family)